VQKLIEAFVALRGSGFTKQQAADDPLLDFLGFPKLIQKPAISSSGGVWNMIISPG
jgi:hypothetical protein